FEAPGDANGDNDYNLQVTVTDSGGLTDVQNIVVTVTDVVENTAPTAQNQTYSTFGNTVLEVAGADIPGNEVTSVTSATSLLNGATDTDGDTLSVQAGTFATTEGGSVTIFSDGSFYYTPEAGDTIVADTFTFTILDGNGGSDTATATINVGDRIWYVDDDAAAGGDGTSANPFNSLAPLNTGGSSDSLDGAGDIIYVLDGNYSTSFTLENNQSLLGQAVDLTVDGTTLISGSNSTRPSMTGNINLASGNTIQGLTLNGGISGSNVGTLSVRDMIINSGAIEGIDIDAITGSNVADIEVVDSTFTGQAIRVESQGAARYDLDVINNTFTNVTDDIQAIAGGSGGVHDINYIGNTSTNSGNNSGGDFVIQMLNGADVTFDIQSNNIQLGAQLLSGDAIQVVGNGNAEGRIGGASASEGNIIDGAGGDGIRLDMGGSSTQSAGNINWTILIQNNDIGATNGVADEGIQIISDNHSGTFNLTVEDNTIANTGEQGFQIFHANEVGGSGGTMFARVANNTFTNIPDATETILIQTLESVTLNLDLQGNDGNGLDGGSGGDEIELDEFAPSLFRLEQTSAANISAVNNGASVEFDTSITDFGVSVNPTLPSNA
ncbi:MAG: hypothetical protein F6J92_14510, partial [Symploca sp. SIO1A3]|nr:hypothetical protein [Symploca sp. SIO1A3]